MSGINWDNVKNEAIAHLQNLIRINTTNPPGNELEAVRYISGVLAKEGIPHEIFESFPGRGNLVARLKGNGARRPLLLTSHVDTVPAEKEHWNVDPFSGEIKEGSIWGRGAVDMKYMTAMELMMLVLAKRSGQPLSRDLILSAVADEETGCRLGSQWLVANKPGLLDAEYALNEIGGFNIPAGGRNLYPIGVSERGVLWFKIVAHGASGHASVPHDDQAIVKLANVAAKLGKKSLPFHSGDVSEKFVRGLAGLNRGPRKWLVKLLLVPQLHNFVLSLFPDKKRAHSLYALFHNTLAPTVFAGGEKINVIPSRAELEVDGRIVPGQTAETLLMEVKKIIGAGFGIEISFSSDPVKTDYENDFFRLLCRSVERHDSKANCVPWLILGFTDAAYYRRLGVKCYGFAPVRFSENTVFSELVHAHNERIPVEGFVFGLRVLWDVVSTA